VKKSKERPIFKNPNNPVEMFCKERVEGYWIRGQIEQLTYEIYDEKADEYVGKAYYHLEILAAFDDAYMKNPENALYPQFGMIVEGTKEKFLDFIKFISKMQWKKLKQHTDISLKECENMSIKEQNPTLNIDLSRIDFENGYIKEAIKNKKELILLNIKMSFDRVEYSSKHRASFPEGIFPIPAYYFHDFDSFENSNINLDDIYQMLYFGFECDLLGERDYLKTLEKIGALCWRWITEKTINKEMIDELDGFQASMKDRSNILLSFCYDFYDDLINDLIKHKALGKCLYCGRTFKHKPDKKYCSLSVDGRDCGTKARNRRFYEKNKIKLLPKLRQSSREYKAFLKRQ
jgi:hypothetical protein